MSWEAIIAILLPLLVYVYLEKRKGLKIAVKASLVMATVLVAYFVIRYDFNDKLLWFEYALLLGLGLITIKMNNDHFFKFQPAVVGMALGGYVVIIHFVEGPIMLRYLPLMEKMIEDPQMQAMLRAEHMHALLAKMSLWFGVIMLVHAAVMIVAALKWSTVQWMWARLSIYPILALASLLAGLLS